MKIIQAVATFFSAIMMVHHAQANDYTAGEIASLSIVEQEVDVEDALEVAGLRGHRELWRYEQNIKCYNRSGEKAYVQWVKQNDNISGGGTLPAARSTICVKMNCGNEGWKSVHNKGKKYAVCKWKTKDDGSKDFWITYTNSRPS